MLEFVIHQQLVHVVENKGRNLTKTFQRFVIYEQKSYKQLVIKIQRTKMLVLTKINISILSN